jgi:hypothetical protein
MKTTLNMHIDILDKITFAAQLKGISRSEMIAMFIKKAMEKMGNPDNLGKLVQYQEKNSPDEWHTFHVRWKPDEYEYFIDMRKLWKMSVSLILAYAVKKFLKKLLKNNSGDNNRYNHYILAKNVMDGIVIWKLIWGFPPHLDKFL